MFQVKHTENIKLTRLFKVKLRANRGNITQEELYRQTDQQYSKAQAQRHPYLNYMTT